MSTGLEQQGRDEERERGARALFDYLKQAAIDMRTVTYQEVSEAVPEAGDWRGVGMKLEHLAEVILAPRGLPMLNAIVVAKSNRRPGRGWRQHAGTQDWSMKHEVEWRGAVLAVFAYPWQQVHYDGDLGSPPPTQSA